MHPLSANKFRKIKSAITLTDCSLGSNGDEDLVAWWYSGFFKNRKDSSQPNILVLFRKVSSTGVFGDIVRRQVPLVALGQIRVGTIWRNDRCTAEINHITKEFTVDFTPGQWRFTSFQDAARQNRSPPYPMDIHPLLYPKDKNWLIEFDLPDGGRLLIPCIEFFSRCYGRSGEVKRVLATYPWDGPGDTATSRLFAPLDTPEEDGRWQVCLRKKVHNGDVVFLAHAKYDEYTRLVAKKVHSQLSASYDPTSVHPTFIEIGPWFQGPAVLSVEGISFDGNSFLGLRVRGMSDPGGSIVLRQRENSGNPENPAPDGSPEAWAGVPKRALLQHPEIINLTGDFAPDHGEGAVEIQDPDFVVLGKARAVIDVRRQQATTESGPSKGPSDVPEVSGGEASGSGKGVGYASIHAKTVFESHGVLRDMWDAMLGLQMTRPDVVQDVAWFTFADGFCTDPNPALIALEPFKKDVDVPLDVRRFPYLDPSTQSLRGLLVARLITFAGPVYIVEIMRRPKRVSADDGTVKDSEEQFQGLVFHLEHEKLFVPWLRDVASLIRHEKGVFRRLTAACPGTADSFSHRLPSNLTANRLPCESIIMRALSKVVSLSQL
jgi:hypothetical protein